MAENKLLGDILRHAANIYDAEEQRLFLIAECSKLPEENKIDDDTLCTIIQDFSETLEKLGTKVLEYKLDKIVLSDSGNENLQSAKQLIKQHLMIAEPSEVDEAILLLEEKLHLTGAQKRILVKYYREEKRRSQQTAMIGEGDYDMDSTSGRARIVREFADIFMSKQRQEGHPVKYINGSLRLYMNGIYPESDEVIAFMKKDLVDIGKANHVNLTPSLVDQTIKLIEIECLVKSDECEPEKDYTVVLNNGLLDTRDWVFRPFDMNKVYFSKIPVDYLPDAPKPENFIKFIDSCFAGNEVQKDLLQEAFGYTLMKTYKYQDIFYLLGDGGNGKGSAVSVLRMMLGSENVASFSLMQLTDGEHIDYNIAMLQGKYLNVCGDVGKRPVNNTETLKMLSSNTDPVTGRHVRSKPIQFINYAKMFFLMNRAPEIEAHTTGDKRRIRIINFINNFAEKKDEVKDIHKVIYDAGELPGILLWAIEGLKRLETNKGFTDSRSIVQRSIEYDKKANTVHYFVEECLFEDPGSVVPNAMMYQAYNTFRKTVGGAELGEKELKAAILKECREAGWNNVSNVQKRSTQLPAPMKDFMESILGVKSGRCFFGISIVREEPQKEIEAFVEPEVMLATNDAEMYEMMQKGVNSLP